MFSCTNLANNFYLLVWLKLKSNAGTLIPLIQKHVVPGSTVITDLWAGYRGLQYYGYTHYAVNHSNRAHPFVDPRTGAHTNSVEVIVRFCDQEILLSEQMEILMASKILIEHRNLLKFTASWWQLDDLKHVANFQNMWMLTKRRHKVESGTSRTALPSYLEQVRIYKNSPY